MARYFPILDAFHSHHPRDFLADIQAGIIISIVMIPQSIAYADLAGLPPEVGLHTAIVTFLIYALIGPSRQMAVGPTSIGSLMVALALMPHRFTSEQYVMSAIFLALVVGSFFLILGIFKVGNLENFISQPVLLGLTTAMVLIITIAQTPHLLGIHIDYGNGSHHIIQTLLLLILQAGKMRWEVLMIGSVGIASIIICRRINPLIPGPLINMLLGAGLMFAISRLFGHTVDVVGEIRSSLPVFSPPRLTPLLGTGATMPASLVRAGLAIGIVTYLQTISAAKILAGRTGRRLDANRELIALGVANLGGAMFHCYPAAGSLTTSSASYRAGSRSQLASVVSVLMTILTLIYLTPYLSRVPRACLSAIIVVSVLSLIHMPSISRAFRIKKSDGMVIVMTFILTLALGADTGIFFGIIVSLGMIIWQTARPRISCMGAPGGVSSGGDRDQPAVQATDPAVIIVKVEGPLLFTSVSYIENTVINLLVDNPKVGTVILDAVAITDLDTSGEKMLWDLLRMMILREMDFVIAGATQTVTKIMHRSGFQKFLGAENYYSSVSDAIAARHRVN